MIVGTIGEGTLSAWYEGVVFRPAPVYGEGEDGIEGDGGWRLRAPEGGEAAEQAAMELDGFFAPYDGKRIRVTVEILPD